MAKSRSNADAISDQHFQHFGADLRKMILPVTKMTEPQRYQHQKLQFDRLWELETKFRQTLIAHRWGPRVYRKFLYHINHERRNILAARPYFRERQDVFTRSISRALRKGNVQDLYRFRFNYNLVAFVLRSQKWGVVGGSKKILALARELQELRQRIVVENLPLAINRARIFYSHTPKSHLSLMDLVQTCTDGLLSGVDKYCPPFSRVFRGVAIGRMVGNCIESYSSTSVHFFPRDKRIIYRANKILGQQPPEEGLDFDQLAERVNKGMDAAHRTTGAELALLLAAASTVSTDTTTTPQDGGDPQPCEERFAADPATRPDVMVEEAEIQIKFRNGLDTLSLQARKLLRLKGVEVAVNVEAL